MIISRVDAQKELIGAYSVSFNNVNNGEECSIVYINSNYYFEMKGQRTQLMESKGALTASDQGQQIWIRSNGNNAEMTLAGLNFQLTRKNSISRNPDMSKPEPSSYNNNISQDKFAGTYKGQLFGMDCILIINKASNINYSIYVNGIGPDEAFLENGVLSGISSGIPFTLKIRNDKLVLTMYDQDLIFEKDVNIENQQPNNKQRVDGSYLESSSEYSKKEIGVNNNNQDDIVGNYDIMNHDKFIIEVSIRNYSGNKYVGNSSKSEFYFVKNSSGEFIGEGFSFRFSGNNLILNENGQEFRLVNRRPYKLIPKEVLKIDDRLLGNWKGTSSSYYGGHSTVTKYQINFRNDGSYLEVTDFSTGGYSGSASLLDDAKKGNYHIIQQTNTGGKIKIYGKELEYVLLNDNKKLFLYGVTYYKQ